jgi:electron transport complex protein RnfA
MIASLGIFAGLAVNLIIQLGLGLGEIGSVQCRLLRRRIWFQWAILFIAVFSLWFVFTSIIAPLSLGFLNYMLIFPLSALVCMGLETCTVKLLFKKEDISPMFSAASAYNGLAVTALFLTIHLAASPGEAAVLSLSFAVGAFLAAFILCEIRRRASIEKLPPFLRGAPLTLISAGLLSLIFSSAALLLFRALR